MSAKIHLNKISSINTFDSNNFNSIKGIISKNPSKKVLIEGLKKIQQFDPSFSDLKEQLYLEILSQEKQRAAIDEIIPILVEESFLNQNMVKRIYNWMLEEFSDDESLSASISDLAWLIENRKESVSLEIGFIKKALISFAKHIIELIQKKEKSFTAFSLFLISINISILFIGDIFPNKATSFIGVFSSCVMIFYVGAYFVFYNFFEDEINAAQLGLIDKCKLSTTSYFEYSFNKITKHESKYRDIVSPYNLIISFAVYTAAFAVLFQSISHIKPGLFIFEGEVKFWSWMILVIVNIFKAIDIFDFTTTYGLDLDPIKYQGIFLGSVFFGMKIVIDIFLLSRYQAWASKNEMKKRSLIAIGGSSNQANNALMNLIRLGNEGIEILYKTLEQSESRIIKKRIMKAFEEIYDRDEGLDTPRGMQVAIKTLKEAHENDFNFYLEIILSQEGQKYKTIPELVKLIMETKKYNSLINISEHLEFFLDDQATTSSSEIDNFNQSLALIINQLKSFLNNPQNKNIDKSIKISVANAIAFIDKDLSSHEYNSYFSQDEILDTEFGENIKGLIWTFLISDKKNKSTISDFILNAYQYIIQPPTGNTDDELDEYELNVHGDWGIIKEAIQNKLITSDEFIEKIVPSILNHLSCLNNLNQYLGVDTTSEIAKILIETLYELKKQKKINHVDLDGYLRLPWIKKSVPTILRMQQSIDISLDYDLIEKLSSIKSVGRNKATLIVESFPTIKILKSISQEDLLSIKGIGKQNAERIIQFIRNEL